VRRGLAVCLLLLLALAGGGKALGAWRPAPLEPIHPVALRICRESPLLRPACPRTVLAALYLRSGIFVAYGKKIGTPYDVFNLEGVGDATGLEREPRTRHLVIYASRASLTTATGPFADWKPLRHGNIRVGATQRGRAVLLGSVRWGGRSGKLVLDRPYPAGGMTGNHLVFLWRSGDVRYAVTLHEWEPLPEAVATLRAIVRSIP
jgi:hypothetical protein